MQAEKKNNLDLYPLSWWLSIIHAYIKKMQAGEKHVQ